MTVHDPTPLVDAGGTGKRAHAARDDQIGVDDRAGEEIVSVVIPVFNEEQSIRILYDELCAALSTWGGRFELIFVNDGSTDRTAAALATLAADPRVVAIHFRRNFGQTAALSAGIDHARGTIIVPIDADLQNDPADIPALVDKLAGGYDVVSGWRRDRRDPYFSRILPSRIANWLISTISGVRLHDYGCSLKAYRRDCVAGVRLYGEMHRFVPIYVSMQGGRVSEMVVRHRARRFGRSHYGAARIVKVLLDLLLVKFLVSYSSKPIYVFGSFGLVCLAAGIATAVLAFFFKFAPVAAWQKDFVETPLPVVTAVCVLVGMLAILQGLLAEMLMRTYFESQGKSTYVVDRLERAGASDDARRPTDTRP